MKALLLIDIQTGFCPGGNLAVADPVGEKSVYRPHVFAVHAREIRLSAVHGWATRRPASAGAN